MPENNLFFILLLFSGRNDKISECYPNNPPKVANFLKNYFKQLLKTLSVYHIKFTSIRGKFHFSCILFFYPENEAFSGQNPNIACFIRKMKLSPDEISFLLCQCSFPKVFIKYKFISAHMFLQVNKKRGQRYAILLFFQSIQLVVCRIIKFILQNREVRNFHEIDFAFVLSFPFVDNGEHSLVEICSQNRSDL